MRIRSLMLAGVSLAVAVTAALASDGQVMFRGVDPVGVRQARDAAPKLVFDATTGLLLGGAATSTAAPFEGSNDPIRLTASGGEIRVCPASGQCGSWSASGMVTDGDMVQARRAGPTAPGQTVKVDVTGLGLIASFEATARSSAPSIGPFPSRTISPGVSVESALSTFTGWVSTRLTVSGGEARVCASQGSCGSWSASSDVHDGDQVQLRGVAGPFGTTRPVMVEAGGATATFDVVSRSKDTAPDAYALGTGPTNAALSSVQTSDQITLAGFDDAPISVTGGTYSLNGAAYTTAAGTTKAGDTVRVQVTSSGSFLQTTTATLDIGGVTGSFSATTRTKDTQPDAYALGTGPTDVVVASTSTSNLVTLTGFDDAPISVSGTGATYSLNGGTYTTAAGTAKAGDTVRVQLAAGSFGESRTATLSVGGVTGTWSSTVRGKDTQPDTYAFTATTNAPPSATQTSNLVTLAGFDDAPISVSGGSYSLNGGTFTTATGTAKPGDTVRVQVVSNAAFGQTATATLSVGGVAGSFTTTTRTKDTTPDPYSLGTGPSGIEPGSISTSNLVTLSGFDDAPISVSGTGASFSFNNGAYTTTPTTIRPGDNVRVQLVAGTYGETRTATLSVGGVTGTWSSVVRARDTQPDAIANFGTLSNQTAGAVVMSDVRQLTGHDGVTVTVSGSGATVRSCTTSTCSGGTQSAFAATATVASGQFVQLQMTVGAQGSDAQTASLSYGATSPATWSVQAVSAVSSTFPSTGWVTQAGTGNQQTRCESVSGSTCYMPRVRFLDAPSYEGRPHNHSSNNLTTYCQQLGWNSIKSVTYGSASCPPGMLFWSGSYDGNSTPKWADWLDGSIKNGATYCSPGDSFITSITCQ